METMWSGWLQEQADKAFPTFSQVTKCFEMVQPSKRVRDYVPRALDEQRRIPQIPTEVRTVPLEPDAPMLPVGFSRKDLSELVYVAICLNNNMYLGTAALLTGLETYDDDPRGLLLFLIKIQPILNRFGSGIELEPYYSRLTRAYSNLLSSLGIEWNYGEELPEDIQDLLSAEYYYDEEIEGAVDDLLEKYGYVQA